VWLRDEFFDLRGASFPLSGSSGPGIRRAAAIHVIVSEAKQSTARQVETWIASLRSQ
jgi:hypothetical protein